MKVPTRGGDLVLKTVAEIMRGANTSKFAAKWEGPFTVIETSDNGYCKIARLGSEVPLKYPINVKWLKMYYP